MRLVSRMKSVPVQLFAIFFAIYAITASGGLEVADADVRYETAKSWLAGTGGELELSSPHGVLAPDGRRYAFYGPLQSVLMLPVVLLAEHVSHGSPDKISKSLFGLVAIPLISALSMAILFQALRALGYGERASFWTTAVVGVATPLWFYGRSGQEENIIALSLGLYLWGMALLFRDRFAGLQLVGLAASIVIATRWSYLPTLGMILAPVGVLLWRRRSDWLIWWKSLAVGSGFAVATLSGVLWYNYHRFGKVLETGYGIYFKHRHESFFTFASAPAHAAALLFSPYRGILLFCPALLVLLGLRKAGVWEAVTKLWPSTLAAWIVTWLFIASFAVWNAGAAWGPRYLVAPIILLAPMLAAVFASGQRWRVVIALSVFVQILSTMLPSVTEDAVYDGRNQVSPGTCTPWSCNCTALCLRAPWALRAVDNTILSRPLPLLEASPSAAAPPEVDMLSTSDFRSVYWWPVRVAYRTHRFSPALAFTLCLAVLAAAFSALGFSYRRLPRDPLVASAAPLG
ncbi:MAG TPA: hypothetical protein VNW92_27870 [Polyangiaceae bacterium]|jgi:hypothetical protein|nr:hypothetical protein [Polyangiaceae bacterium]